MLKKQNSRVLLAWYLIKLALHYAEKDGERFEELLQFAKREHHNLRNGGMATFNRMGTVDRIADAVVSLMKLIRED